VIAGYLLDWCDCRLSFRSYFLHKWLRVRRFDKFLWTILGLTHTHTEIQMDNFGPQTDRQTDRQTDTLLIFIPIDKPRSGLTPLITVDGVSKRLITMKTVDEIDGVSKRHITMKTVDEKQ